jgi:hypothetical protein
MVTLFLFSGVAGTKMDWTIERVDGLASSAKASATQETRRILFAPGGSAQPIEKAQNGQGNTRKSKPWGQTHRVAALYFAIYGKRTIDLLKTPPTVISRL